jgi:hypothetical protein
MATYSYKEVHEEGVSAVTATPSVQVGTRRLNNGIEYVYCYNAGNAASDGATRIGSPVILTGVSGYTFTANTFTTAADFSSTFSFLGVTHNATCPSGSYCWVATRGPVSVYCDSVAVVAGDNVTMADGGIAFTVITFTSELTQFVGMPFFRALSTKAAASGIVSIYLK